MATITSSARTADTAISTADDDLGNDTSVIELVVLLLLFVGLVGFAVTHLDTVLVGFGSLAGR